VRVQVETRRGVGCATHLKRSNTGQELVREAREVFGLRTEEVGRQLRDGGHGTSGLTKAFLAQRSFHRHDSRTIDRSNNQQREANKRWRDEQARERDHTTNKRVFQSNNW